MIRTMPFLYADISSDKERFTKGRSCSFKNFSHIFEKQFKNNSNRSIIFYFISVIFFINWSNRS